MNFTLESALPNEGTLDVLPNQALELLFSSPLDRASLGLGLEAVTDFIDVLVATTGDPVAGLWTLDTFDRRLVFTPQPAWPGPGQEIVVMISPDLLEELHNIDTSRTRREKTINARQQSARIGSVLMALPGMSRPRVIEEVEQTRVAQSNIALIGNELQVAFALRRMLVGRPRTKRC